MNTLFGRTAVKAIGLIRAGNCSPDAAWLEAITDETNNPSQIAKGCPKNTFLSLVDAGLICGIPAKHLRNESVNGRYGMIAIEYLKSHPEFEGNGSELWNILSDQFGAENHNSQMDVVLALFYAGEIVVK